MTSVSILIVTYNSENEIEDCLNSILSNFDDIELEIIIADNNSSDNTINIIKNISSNNIKLITNSNNIGYTKAVNQCLEIAIKNNILILNPDTIIPNDSLKQLINTFDNDDSHGIVAPQLKYPNGDIQKSCRRFPRRRDFVYESFGLSRFFSNSIEFGFWKMTDFDHNKSRLVEQPAGAALLLKKKLIDKIGFFDKRFPMFFSDVDYCHRVIKEGYSINYDISATIIHKGGASIFRNRIKMLISSHLSIIKYFSKYSNGLIDYIYNLLLALFLIIITPIRIVLHLLFPNLGRNNTTL